MLIPSKPICAVIVHRRDAEDAEKINIFLKPLRHYMIMDINKLSGKIIGAAIEVHKALGPGLLEFQPVKYEVHLTGVTGK